MPLSISHFDFFTGPPDERDPAMREEVQQELVSLWELVRDELTEMDGKALGAIYAGPVLARDDHAWAQTNRDDEFADVVNLTLELGAADLQLNLVGGTTPQAEQLVKWLRSPGGREFWRSFDDYVLVVFLREAHGGKRPVWQGARWTELARYSAKEVARRGIVPIRSHHAFGLDDTRQRLAYHVRRDWTKEYVLRDGSLVGDVAGHVQALLPALRSARTTAIS